MIVDLRCNSEMWAYYSGRYDWESISEIHRLLDKNKCFIDVGANIGFYVVSVGAHIRGLRAAGKAIAFEPFSRNYQRLVENIGINDLSEYCLSFAYGLSDSSTETEITLREDFIHGSETGNAAIATNKDFDKGFARTTIKLERLDDVWSAEPFRSLSIDVIKIDIEGHEDFFLRGAKDTIFQHRPTILMEVNKPYYRARQTDLDRQTFDLIPPAYCRFRHVGGDWVKFEHFEQCGDLENVFLIPSEKIQTEPYRRFR